MEFASTRTIGLSDLKGILATVRQKSAKGQCYACCENEVRECCRVMAAFVAKAMCREVVDDCVKRSAARKNQLLFTAKAVEQTDRFASIR